MHRRPGRCGAASAFTGAGQADLGAFVELIHAGHDDLVAGLEARGDFGILAFGGADGDVADGDGEVRLDEVDVGVSGGALDGGGVEQGDAALLFDEEAGVDELVGVEGRSGSRRWRGA